MARPVTVAQTGAGHSKWIRVDNQIVPVNISVGVVVSGTANYTVAYTYDDPETVASPVAWSISALAAKGTTIDAVLTHPIMALKLTVNSGAGTATMTILQSGIKV